MDIKETLLAFLEDFEASEMDTSSYAYHLGLRTDDLLKLLEIARGL